MKNKKAVAEQRNWGLVFVSSILILIGVVLILLAVMYSKEFGWWSLLLGASGLSTIGAATMSIIKNDPTWILLNLIIPSW